MESHRRLTNPQQAPSVSLLKMGQPDHSPYTKQELGKNLLRLGAGSAGLGMGAAGLFGLLNYLTAKDRPSANQPTLIKIDKRPREKQEEENILEDVVEDAVEDAVEDTPEDTPEDILPFPKVADGWLNPFDAKVYHDYPTYPAMAIATMGGGGIAGWKAIEWLLKKMRKSKRKGELENARQDYEAALREQYGSKEGAHNTYAALDNVYDACVKQAANGAENKMRPEGGIGTGLWNLLTNNPASEDYYKYMVMTPALLGALGFGYLSYQNRQDRSRQKALREAKRRRALELAQRRPTRFIAELEEEEENE